MTTSPYVTAYSRCCYGRVAESVIQTFLNDAVNNGEYDPNNLADLTLADYLEDHDDPRHHIIRKDLSYRGVDGNTFHTNTPNIANYTIEKSYYRDLGHNQYTVAYKLNNNNTGSALYKINYHGKSDSDKNVIYISYFDKDEGEQLINNLIEHGLLSETPETLL